MLAQTSVETCCFVIMTHYDNRIGWGDESLCALYVEQSMALWVKKKKKRRGRTERWEIRNELERNA